MRAEEPLTILAVSALRGAALLAAFVALALTLAGG